MEIEIIEKKIESEEEDDDDISTFDKLKNIQILLKKESSLKEICKKYILLYNYFFSY